MTCKNQCEYCHNSMACSLLKQALAITKRKIESETAGNKLALYDQILLDLEQNAWSYPSNRAKCRFEDSKSSINAIIACLISLELENKDKEDIRECKLISK